MEANMKHRINLLDAVEYSDERVLIDEMISTPSSKEMRVMIQKNQVMRDHASVYPIAINVLEGVVKLSADGNDTVLRRGDLIYMESDTVHHMEAVEDTILRLTLFTAAEV